MAAASPYLLLQEYDGRCRDHALGLPTGSQVVDDWVGIGFRLAGVRLIAPMNHVVEILTAPDTIRVPGVLNWVLGLANVRGNLMPVLDMNLFMGRSAVSAGSVSRVLVIDRESVVAALLVEEVFGLRRFKPDMKQPSGASGERALNAYLDGGFDDGQNFWRVFSVDKLLQDEQFMKVI